MGATAGVACAEPDLSASRSPIYRPRRPRENPLFKILSDHYATFREDYRERYEKIWSRFRRGVDRTVKGFLRCGLPEHGFRDSHPTGAVERLGPGGARMQRAPVGRGPRRPRSVRQLPHRVPAAVQLQACPELVEGTRGLRTSCAAKRTAAWARWFVEKLVRPVPHRHVVVTLPKILRPAFKFDRSLLTDLAGWIHECVGEIMAPLAKEPVRPGSVPLRYAENAARALESCQRLAVALDARVADGQERLEQDEERRGAHPRGRGARAAPLRARLRSAGPARRPTLSCASREGRGAAPGPRAGDRGRARAPRSGAAPRARRGGAPFATRTGGERPAPGLRPRAPGRGGRDVVPGLPVEDWERDMDPATSRAT
jgi:hypothetical protein